MFSSTYVIYGDHNNSTLSENTSIVKNPYGASKGIEIIIIFSFCRFKICNFRYFSVAGADPDGEIGEFHKPETHLI